MICGNPLNQTQHSSRLVLEMLVIKQNASETRDVGRGSSASKTDGSDVTGICLDMKTNKQLKTLSFTKIHLGNYKYSAC